MVLNSSSTTPVQGTPDAAAGSAPTGAFDAQAHVPGFGPWMRGGWGRHMRGMGHPLFRPETVPLEGNDGFHGGPPHHHHPHPPPPEGQTHPDPPLAQIPPFSPHAPPMGDFMPGLAGLMGHHARAFCGDLANHFGPPPPPPPFPGEAPGPGGPPHQSREFSGFGGWRGRGGRGRGGFGGWRGRFPRGPHFPPRDFDLPRMDIYQNNNTYTITVELPGLQKQNVDISVDEGLLSISGEYPASSGAPTTEEPFEDYDYMADEGEEVEMAAPDYSQERATGDHYIVRERHTGKFKRSIRLPSWVEVSTIKATMADGLLTITLEKPQPQGSTPSVHKVSIA